MTLKLTVLAPVVNIRRGIGNAAGGILRQARIGEQFDAVQVIDTPKSVEQWAKVILPDQLNADAYVCIKLPNGSALCQVSAVPTQVGDAKYQEGFRDGVEHVLRWVSAERAKLG